MGRTAADVGSLTAPLGPSDRARAGGRIGQPSVSHLPDQLQHAHGEGLVHARRQRRGARLQCRLQVVRRDHLGRDLPPERGAQNPRERRPVDDIGRENVGLARMSVRTFGQHLGGDCRDVVARHPTDLSISHRPGDDTIHDRHERQEVLHEEVSMDVAPGQSTPFDVALDQLMPGVVRIGGPAVAEDAQVDKETDAGLDGRVHDRLDLVHHVDRVARHDEQAVDPLQGRGKALWVVQVEDDRGLALGPPRLDLPGVARRSHDLQVWVGDQIAQYRAADRTGRTENEHAWAALGFVAGHRHLP